MKNKKEKIPLSQWHKQVKETNGLQMICLTKPNKGFDIDNLPLKTIKVKMTETQKEDGTKPINWR